jgi:putative membrane-bound dehydrogenase-like protein
MHRASLATAIVVVAVSWMPAAKDELTKSHQVKLNGHTFTLPAGFDIELVAGPPLVDRPIEADFDEEGRLYVSDSSGSNEKLEIQLQKKPHRIVRLEDTDGDGRFDKRTIFADKMMFPEGVMWYAGSLYVAAPPSIWKLTDTDGDGVADRRVEWFKGKTLTGCGNDLHGPYLGPDGWIYWCKGAFAKQTYEQPGKKPFVTRASHIFRSRPDGSGIEPVMTGGMDNPVEVAFTPGGERIFTTTFLQHPGGGKRDGLIHAIYGGIYGKDWDPIYEHKWTGTSVMPVLMHMGAAAPCGLVRYESRVFGAEYQDNLFACQFNMHKVTRHVLTPDGATFTSRDEDFLVSDNLDFHPTDVLEDADGSLLVIDTGGWYKLCCPTAQLHKPDVLGAIYRIRRKGAAHVDDPRGRKLAWTAMQPAELASLLGDERPAVRKRAIEELGRRGPEAVPALAAVIRVGLPGVDHDASVAGKVAASSLARCNAVWALTHIQDHEARATARLALADTDEIVRQAAIHSASVWRDGQSYSGLLGLLSNRSLQNRRAAAEALGRIGDKRAVPSLLYWAGRQQDRVLEHSLIFALIEISDRDGTAAGLRMVEPSTRRAALIALDQMDGGKLEAKTVAAELGSPEPKMRETAWWVAGHHADWGGALAGFLRERLSAKEVSKDQQDELVRQLARFASAKVVQDLLVDEVRKEDASWQAREVALRAMAQANLKETPSAWCTGLIQVLGKEDDKLVAAAVTTVRAFHVPKAQTASVAAALIKIGRNTGMPLAVRLSALAAVPGGLAPVEPALFTLLRDNLAADQAVSVRSAAVDVLSHAKLSSEQLLALTESLKAVGPTEVDRLLQAFAQSADEKVGLALIAALKASPARASLGVGSVKPNLAKFGEPVQKQAQELFALLNVDAAKQRAKLEQLLGSLKGGDIRRGQAVFNSTKAACSACHAIGYLGGNVGPDLTRIGGIRSERDLLESIVFPSASFVRSYEPVVVITKDGRSYNGVIRKDSPDELVLATGINQEARIARDNIEEMQPSKVSVMPAGLDQQLTVRELADLVAFLKACK